MYSLCEIICKMGKKFLSTNEQLFHTCHTPTFVGAGSAPAFEGSESPGVGVNNSYKYVIPAQAGIQVYAWHINSIEIIWIFF